MYRPSITDGNAFLQGERGRVCDFSILAVHRLPSLIIVLYGQNQKIADPPLIGTDFLTANGSFCRLLSGGPKVHMPPSVCGIFKMHCPHCGSTSIRRSQSPISLVAMLFCVQLRCRHCWYRFLAPAWYRLTIRPKSRFRQSRQRTGAVA